MIVGHDLAREQLERELPPVALLLGPASVGKHTLARHLIEHHGVHKADTIFVRTLHMADARTIQAVAETRSLGSFKVFVVSLDGASNGALQAMLKLLEEPPPTIRFILIASARPLETIVSRSRVFPCGLLTTEQVTQVLELVGLDVVLARKIAPMGGGRVQAALDAHTAEKPKAAAIAALKAAESRNAIALQAALREWGPEDHKMLGTWSAEAAVGRWRVFSGSQVPGLGPADARVLLSALSRQGLARPKLAASAALGVLIDRR